MDDASSSGAHARGRPWRVAALVLVLLLFPVVQLYFVPRLPFLQGVPLPDRSDWWALVVWLVAWEWALFLAVAVSLRRSGRSLRDVGFPRLSRSQGLAAGVVVGVAATFLLLAPPDPSAPSGINWYLPRTPGERLVWLGVAVTAGVCEETLFRGFAITELRKLPGAVWTAVLLSTLAFVFIHGPGQDLLSLGRRFGIGVLFALLYLHRNDLRGPIYIHFLTNVAVLYIL